MPSDQSFLSNMSQQLKNATNIFTSVLTVWIMFCPTALAADPQPHSSFQMGEGHSTFFWLLMLGVTLTQGALNALLTLAIRIWLRREVTPRWKLIFWLEFGWATLSYIISWEIYGFIKSDISIGVDQLAFMLSIVSYALLNTYGIFRLSRWAVQDPNP